MGARYPDWVVRHGDLRGLHEIMCWDAQVILLERTRTSTQRRCDLTHALGHLDLAHNGDTFNRKHEDAADRYAAKLLIDIRDLGEALAWSRSVMADTADVLNVDHETLRRRLHHLHPTERAYLRRRLADH